MANIKKNSNVVDKYKHIYKHQHHTSKRSIVATLPKNSQVDVLLLTNPNALLKKEKRFHKTQAISHRESEYTTLL